jgi:hypothetical protein
LFILEGRKGKEEGRGTVSVELFSDDERSNEE